MTTRLPSLVMRPRDRKTPDAVAMLATRRIPDPADQRRRSRSTIWTRSIIRSSSAIKVSELPVGSRHVRATLHDSIRPVGKDEFSEEGKHKDYLQVSDGTRAEQLRSHRRRGVQSRRSVYSPPPKTTSRSMAPPHHRLRTPNAVSSRSYVLIGMAHICTLVLSVCELLTIHEFSTYPGLRRCQDDETHTTSFELTFVPKDT